LIACFATRSVGYRAVIYLIFDIIVAMSDDAARFRKQSEECRAQASKAISPLDKEAWLRTAEEWLKLAQSVDDRQQ
jgi:hypothetical protein